jgi:hypothetical protein
MKTPLLLRIFISFWKAMATILTGAVAVTAIVVWHRITMLSSVNPVELMSEASVTLREQGIFRVEELAAGWPLPEEVEPSGSLRQVSDHMTILLSCPPDATSIVAVLTPLTHTTPKGKCSRDRHAMPPLLSLTS